jgi:hypothetical protein
VCPQAGKSAHQGSVRPVGETRTILFTPCEYLLTGLAPLSARCRYTTRNMRSYGRVEAFMKRFKKELGYWSVRPWAIYDRQDSKTVMYYMIHATDHPDASKLMARAYRKAVTPQETAEQLRFWAQSAGITESGI